MRYVLAITLVQLCSVVSHTQIVLTEAEAIDRVLKTHPAVEVARQEVRAQEILKNSGITWEASQIFHNVTADPDLGLFGTTAVGLQQSFPSVKASRAIRNYHGSMEGQASASLGVVRQEVVKQVREIYQHLSYLEGRRVLLQRLDSVYQRVQRGADVRHEAGDISMAEKLAITDRAAGVRLEMATVEHEIQFDGVVLRQLLGLDQQVQPLAPPLYERSFSLADSTLIDGSARAALSRARVEVARAGQEVARSQLAPTTFAGITGQYLANGAIYPGWQLGLSVPLFRKSLKGHVQAMEAGVAAAEAGHRQILLQQQTAMGHLLHEYEKYKLRLDYYDGEGKNLASLLIKSGELNFSAGEISYSDFALLMEQATGIEMGYLENLLGLNQTIIALEALVGQ
jgi:cobalt-zinc-cadmium resistance protein CzcA